MIKLYSKKNILGWWFILRNKILILVINKTQKENNSLSTNNQNEYLYGFFWIILKEWKKEN